MSDRICPHCGLPFLFGERHIDCKEPAPAAPEAPPELAALQAENQRLREALDEVLNLLCPLCRIKWAALAEKGSNS